MRTGNETHTLNSYPARIWKCCRRSQITPCSRRTCAPSDILYNPTVVRAHVDPQLHWNASTPVAFSRHQIGSPQVLPHLPLRIHMHKVLILHPWSNSLPQPYYQLCSKGMMNLVSHHLCEYRQPKLCCYLLQENDEIGRLSND